IALLAFAQQCGDRHAEKMPEEIEQRRLECRHRVNGRAQIEGLGPAATDIAIREAFPRLVQNIVVHPDRATNDQRPRILQRLTDARATGNFAHARVAGIVLEDDDVASEKRSVRTAQVQEHAVMTSHRYDRHLGHDRRFPRDALRHETLPANSARRKIGRPMVGTFPVCCARAANGHAAAATPISVMNARRRYAELSATIAHEVLQSRRCPSGSLISKNSESESEQRVARMLMWPVILATTPSSSTLKPTSRSAAHRFNLKTLMGPRLSWSWRSYQLERRSGRQSQGKANPPGLNFRIVGGSSMPI